MTDRPAARTRRRTGADAGRLRRPPGGQRRGRGRGADDRRPHLPAGPRPGPLLEPERRLRHPARSGRSPSAARPWSTGTAARSSFPGGTATPPNEDIPPRPTAPAYRLGPAQLPAQRRQGAGAEVGLPPARPAALNNYCTTANRPDPVVASALVPNTGTAIPCHSHGWLGP